MSNVALLVRSRMRNPIWPLFRRAALVMALCSCVPSTGQVPSPLATPAVAVERDTYRVRRTRNGDVLELTIVTTFTNRTADTIVLHPCYGRHPAVTLDKWVGGEWKSAFDKACPDIVVSNAPRLAPGESQTDTAWLSASLRPNGRPRFELGTVPGLYRVVYWGAHRLGVAPSYLGPLLPKELRVSNAFRVVE
jgi:hypothetical protein